jgi:hypothetical protein
MLDRQWIANHRLCHTPLNELKDAGPAVDGLAEFSHVWVLFIFHQNGKGTVLFSPQQPAAPGTIFFHQNGKARSFRFVDHGFRVLGCVRLASSGFGVGLWWISGCGGHGAWVLDTLVPSRMRLGRTWADVKPAQVVSNRLAQVVSNSCSLQCTGHGIAVRPLHSE